ncbi:hypothetical protein LTR10_019463 [Elasticomyces elasticus]|uniref:Fe2OG dioxygenase domain-containing protein n=1 Tax=Exophiala sideris TaxID=1016849 RepID=A0ABR0J219_9EURO|nr:hypothetical protein LTR10_019463 [Elasticomyces elasticus]KAK5024060.1 hypothetical protein LTS07_008794 [Exophiala sideris]KAK5029079.1 hypothetical protein LTR13_008950 [Exophiala sideris]KAK5054772.1 hypothetical protein LTR69_008679 [Exophiala sideris]KAK5178902.1 hypothetical protein LTR44_008731 [Eurotiomycetes sp. CCFEE 6388]
MATAEVLTLPTTTSFGSIKRKRSISKVDMAPKLPRHIPFVPAQHLRFQSPDKIWTMEEIGMADKGVSSTAVSVPFPLFTEEAVHQMRAEVLSQPVWDNCKYSSNLAQCQLRGFAPEYAPFIYDVWHSPEVLAIVSKIAGVELVPAMDFEIAHINISSTGDKEQEDVKQAFQEKEHREADEGVGGCPFEDDRPILDWHTDSYPFVCVTMLSDCTNMIGGETALRKGDGEVMKVRGPGMGHAVVLQGRYIEHQALRAFGGSERITSVTSFRPKSAFVRDDTVLTTVRPISDLSELYSQYAEYRLEMLEERVRGHLKAIRDDKRARRSFDTATTKAFMIEQRNFLDSMLREMVDDELVTVGFCDDSHLLSEDLKLQQRKKTRFQTEGKL